MKYFNFKRNKFSTIFKSIKLRRYNFSKIYKNFNINAYKDFDIKAYKHLPAYFAGSIIIVFFIYLSIPKFFNYDKSNIENLCKKINIVCSVKNEIEYSFFPQPQLKIKNLVIKDFADKKKEFAKIENANIKLSFYNLYNKRKFSYTKIELINARIDFNLSEFDKYKNFHQKENLLKPLDLKNGKVNFYEDKKYIASINNVELKYRSKNAYDEINLKGEFLEDKISINLKKEKEKLATFIALKLLKSNLFAKINLFSKDKEKNVLSGDILFKQNKNRLRGVFDYTDNKIILKKADLRNEFLKGKLSGDIAFLPYFYFNLDFDLNGLNFNKLSNILFILDKNNKDTLYKISNKINGQIDISTNKVYSKYNLINSFESKIQVSNGDISIDRLIFNLGKLGAADISGIVKNNGKFTNFKFENNIFIDNQKKLFSKFGIYNKENIPSNLYVSGNFDLTKSSIRFNEITAEEKLTEQDVTYIEKEFNNILLRDRYLSFFNFLNLKEFVQLVASDEN